MSAGDSGPPPRRISDPTLVIDLQNVISERARAAFAASLRDEDVVPTEVACPTCQRCPDCGGTHMVTKDMRSALLRKETGL